MAIRTLVTEDHTLLRQALVNLLAQDEGIEVVGQASNGFEALAQARQLQPDLILTDLYMPGMDGIALTRLIKRELPKAQVILLTVSTEKDDILKAVQAGAWGYIPKNTDAATLTRQIKRVISSRGALSEDMVSKLLVGLVKKSHTTAEADLPQPLTPREKEVLALLSQGIGNKEIAVRLEISQNTVRSYVRSLMQKLNLDNRTQLALYGVRGGLGLEGSNPDTRNGVSRLVLDQVS